MIITVSGPVVVGIDGSAEATRAARYGAGEAERRNVALNLVFARPPTPTWGPTMLIQGDDEEARASIRDALAAAATDVATAHPDIVMRTSVISGRAAAVLVEESRHASLVVIGTRATGGLIGHLSGSVAAQVAAHAHTTVIVLRPAACVPDPSGGTVVVGLDGSPESQRAMDFAVEQAVARDADLHAVYAWNLLEVRDLGPLVPAGYEAADAEAKALRLLTEATEGWSDRYPDLVIRRRVMHTLDPVEALTTASDGAGLLVVGSRGHGGFLGLRIGSTVDGLIRRAGAPVAVVRTEPAS